MTKFKRFPADITLTNLKETFIEDCGWSFAKKDIDYKQDRTKSTTTYTDCLITKNMWIKTREAILEDNGVLVDIAVGDMQEFDHYIRAYSDGSNNKEGFASYGFTWIHSDGENVVYYEDSQKMKGTNSVGELTGAIDCLKSVYDYINENKLENVLVELTSDSNYVILGHTLHIPKQVERGWRNTSNKPTPNKELWKSMIEVGSNFDSLDKTHLLFKWIKGHKLKAKDTRMIEQDDFFDNIDLNFNKGIINDSEFSTDNIDIIMNERCDVLAKRELEIGKK